VILTVTLNAAIDRTVAVPSFRLGHRHRAVERRTVAGGKGVNVARALKLLGRPVIATGLAGGPTGTRILEQLTEESILNDFTRIGDESRTNLAVIDPTSGEQTEINERGPNVAAGEVDRFVEKLLYLAQGAAFCVIAGSVPPGVDPDVYGRLVTQLKELGVSVLLDTEGEPMRAGLRAGPAVVAPNLAEAEEAVGHEFNDPDDLLLGLQSLIEMGAGEAIITREAGCVAILGEPAERRRFEAEIEALEPVATVGSGDAFLAGYLAARYQGAPTRECLAYGVACGAESTQHFGAGTIDPGEVERLLGQVEVRELDVPAGVA
jgi:1-phosphofructokinase family hexose kinase